MKHLIAISFLLITVFGFSQNSIPIIQANSKSVDIKVGEILNKNQWTIMPELNPDVYEVSDIGKKVTFYTDIDSISITIDEKTKFDFVILLNKKDSAYTQIKYRDSYLKILKKADKYDNEQMREIPKFTYLDSSNIHLKQIRKEFNLDSIAGGGNEVSKLLNIMYWVHDIVRHDGGSNNPTLKNAIDLVKVCKAENRGINCRMMAVILNECYLSLGYKSRMVTCMPRPLEFQDCHVINTVYSKQLNKWIWLDPTFAAYVMDETGELLGLQEVRERLINDQPLILNPEANWNRQNSQTKEGYLYQYMAKNLYRLEVPIHSTYNYETKKKGKTVEYIQLLPLDGINQEPLVEINKNKKSKMTYKTYITNNPDEFWEIEK
ncbi:transglutaminase domain-containing protein [Marinifilum sp.]|uniref:transglutaminase domain-containing protein n=1 Tax=Marinifilum sp. TaxID=2033137 RepID=UPI003BA888C3